jgi:hypothetical protein
MKRLIAITVAIFVLMMSLPACVEKPSAPAPQPELPTTPSPAPVEPLNPRQNLLLNPMSLNIQKGKFARLYGIEFQSSYQVDTVEVNC